MGILGCRLLLYTHPLSLNGGLLGATARHCLLQHSPLHPDTCQAMDALAAGLCFAVTEPFPLGLTTNPAFLASTTSSSEYI